MKNGSNVIINYYCIILVLSNMKILFFLLQHHGDKISNFLSSEQYREMYMNIDNVVVVVLLYFQTFCFTYSGILGYMNVSDVKTLHHWSMKALIIFVPLLTDCWTATNAFKIKFVFDKNEFINRCFPLHFQQKIKNWIFHHSIGFLSYTSVHTHSAV